MSGPLYLRLALPTPLRRRFDYLPPENTQADEVHQWRPGLRLRVPFGRQEMVGILLEVSSHSALSENQLRPAVARLDENPVLPPDLLQLCLWAADYYQCPVGEALHAALPALLRQGHPAHLAGETAWKLTPEGQGLPTGALKRAPRQAQLLSALQSLGQLTRTDLTQLGIPRTAVKALEEKGLLARVELSSQMGASSEPETAPGSAHKTALAEAPLPLTDEQERALAAIGTQGFQVSLLDGATGSGKTEVYLQAIEKVLNEGRQALVLVPEIGLTPQTLSRFQRRFSHPIVALHSGLNDRERLDAWLKASDGRARIVIGTRSAIFTPLAKPGIIIVDEEHDASFKQQEGFRYSARDLAVVRAQQARIPLVLGSATPALESLHNARQGRYQYLRMTQRPGAARPPVIELQDIRGQALEAGFTRDTLAAIQAQLDMGNQILVFLNRRGYAPTLECHDCGWLAECGHCDARMTVHHRPRHLHCHHCDHQRPLPRQCPSCRSSALEPLGQGTERSEAALDSLFPKTQVVRVDRDSTRRKNALRDMMARVNEGHPCLLVGTQMLAKGHHFPNVTLVVILDADAGLFSTDFRGPERMGQILLQVAGRAGRADKPGRVILQSHHIDHPLVQTLMHRGYHDFVELIAHERQLSGLPPYRHLALLRAESKRPENAMEFLRQARASAEALQAPSPELSYLGPLPAMLEKRGDRFRYQLQINSTGRGPLQKLLSELAINLESSPLGRRVRWSIDVDPQDMG